MSCNENLTFQNFGKSIVYAGLIGENDVRTISIDCSAVLAEFTAYTVTLLIQFPNDSAVYPAPCTVTNSVVEHEFTATELQNTGMGRMAIMISSTDGRVKKSANAPLMIGDVLTQPQTVPSEVENWIASISSKLIPDDGVAKNQLSDGVQESLDKADTSLQQSDLLPYRTALDQDILDQEYRESIAPSLAKANTALQASALTPYRTASAQDTLDQEYRESIAPSLAKANTALQAAALEPYRTAANQDAIDSAMMEAIEPKLIPATGVTKSQLASGVQASLDKADTALQPSALTPYRTAAAQDVIDSEFFKTTDATLTESGKPADAKAVGDAFAALPASYQNSSPAIYTSHENEAYSSRTLSDVWQVNNSADRDAQSFVVKFEPQQNGTPSVETPVPITGSTALSVRVGKGNLYTGVRQTGHTLSTSGEVTSSSGYQVSDWINVERLKTIRAYYYNSSNGYRVNRICFYRADKTFLSQETPTNAATNSWKSYIVDVPQGAVYARLANMQTSPNFMVVMGDNQYYTIDLPESAKPLFGGTVDLVSGTIVSTMGEIESYDGELLPGKWMSSMDIYTEGGTPTTGAQVVFELSAPVIYNITPQPVHMYEGQTCAQSIITAPYNRGLYAEYVRGDLLISSDIDNMLNAAGKAADAKATGDVISGIGWGVMTAEVNIDSGTYFIAGNSLYIATSAIAAGETVTPGTNCTKTDVVEVLNTLKNAIA